MGCSIGALTPERLKSSLPSYGWAQVQPGGVSATYTCHRMMQTSHNKTEKYRNAA